MNDFETTLSHYNERCYGVICANPTFSALASIMSPKSGERQLKQGQEVITSLIGSTVSIILGLGLVPVFVDVDIPSYNANPCLVAEAVTKNTGAILLQHTLGNPVSLSYIEDKVVEGTEIWSIYDCGSSIGGIYTGTYEGHPLGSFGCLATYLFHLKTGMVLTNSPMIHASLEKYSKPAPWEDEQMKLLPGKIKARRENWKYYYGAFRAEGLEEYFILPKAHRLADPCWVGFCVTSRGIDREKLMHYLKSKGVVAKTLPRQETRKFKVIGTSRRADVVAKNSFWISTSPAITPELREYAVDTFKKGLKL